MKTKEMQISCTNEELVNNLGAIRAILGDNFNAEKVKQFLHGADNNIEIALNHLLNSLEKEEQWRTQNANVNSLDKVLNDLAEEVRCPLCLSYFNQPVALGCFHTFCLPCLEELVSQEEDQTTIGCPLCRASFALGEQGIRGLQPNHYVANIVDKIKAAQSTRMCGECRLRICSVHCKECDMFLCNDCNTRIHSVRLLLQHHRVPFEDCFFNSPARPKGPRTINDLLREYDYVLPCNVTKDVCMDLFTSWAKELWFAPFDLAQKAIVQEFRLLYVPFWLFEVEAKTRYCFMLGYGRKDMNWTSSLGSVSTSITDLLVPACDSLSLDLGSLAALEPWKLDHLQPFTLKHAESAEVLPFSTDEDASWDEKGKFRVDEICKEAVLAKLKKNSKIDSLEHVSVQTWCSTKRARRLFVPVFSTTYTFRNVVYRFFINGTSAKVHGTRPFSANKFASIGLTGVGAVFGLISSRLS